MPAQLLEVIWIDDSFIRPPGPKMVACLAPRAGIFVRINSENKWPVGVPLTRHLHPFLRHDSYLQCGDPLELDDYVIDQSRARHAAPMQLDRSLLPALMAAITRSHRISDRDRAIILAALAAA